MYQQLCWCTEQCPARDYGINKHRPNLKGFFEVVLFLLFCAKQTPTSVTVNLTVWFGEVMAFWHRIRNPNLKTLCIQFQRCYIHRPHASTPKPFPVDIPHPNSVFHGRPTSVFNTVRFFAAPLQVIFETFIGWDYQSCCLCSVFWNGLLSNGSYVVGLALVVKVVLFWIWWYFVGFFQYQVKHKNEEDSGDLRLNEKIKAPYVRLVVDDGKPITHLNWGWFGCLLF